MLVLVKISINVSNNCQFLELVMSLGMQGVLVQLSAVATGAGGKPSFYSWSDNSPTDHPLNLMMMMMMITQLIALLD